jgi:IS4 transposase
MVDNKMEQVLRAELSEEDAAKVLAALEAVTTDPAVGTVLRHPNSGDVALHVRQYDKTYWRIYSTDDRTWIEQELVGWDVLHEAAAVATTPGDAAVDPVEAAAPAKKTK